MNIFYKKLSAYFLGTWEEKFCAMKSGMNLSGFEIKEKYAVVEN